MYLTREFVAGKPAGRYLCPVCEGGSTGETSLNIWHEGYYAHAKCHRASCTSYARFPVSGYDYTYQAQGVGENASPAPSPEVLRPYTGDRYPLTAYPNVLEAFKKRYGFSPQGVFTCSYGNAPLLIPILSPRGQVRGHVEKHGLFPGEQKSNRIWKGKHEPMISWTPPSGDPDFVLLVEDQISALKYAQSTGKRACALLGTSLSIDSVAEIQRQVDHVTIALDADASARAFRLARRWGAAFKSCTVKILTKDIKDDPQYNQMDFSLLNNPGSVIHTSRHWLPGHSYL